MESEYKKVKGGLLRLKGEKIPKKHKSKKRKHEDSTPVNEDEIDTTKHGGWWKATSLSEIKGQVALQYGNRAAYLKAMDQGHFTIGMIHDEGDAPSPDEILTVVPAGSDKLAFKSGYGKYLGLTKKGLLVGISDAIGSQEKWEPVFQEGKSALLGANDLFVTVNDDEDIIASSSTAEDNEMISIRCNGERERDKKPSLPEEERGKLKDIERNYVKKFQKFQDKKVKINSEGHAELKRSKEEGHLHESLLDRRSKMKADRYCK